MKLLNISPLMIRILGLVLILASPVAIAAEGLKPFVLAATIDDKTLAEAGSEIEAKLQKAGFDVIGQYSPYENTVILVFTSMELRELATRSKRGGYGATGPTPIACRRMPHRLQHN
jgi:hypothetical protein